MKTTTWQALLLVVTFLFSCNEFKEIVDPEKPEPEKPGKPFEKYSNQIILDWNTVAQQIMSGPDYSPLIASRIHTMVHLAMHDALNNIAPVYETYALKNVDHDADPIAAAATAAHTVLSLSFPAKQAQLDSALNHSLASAKNTRAKDRGIALGKEAGQAFVNLRINDGAFQDPVGEINNPVEPGVYQPVPPSPFLYAPFWATMQPFSLESPHQFRNSPMPDLNSETYTTHFNEVKRVGVKNSDTRTADQTAYAKFWYELSEIGWNRITFIVASDKKLDLLSTARLFALVNMALADAYTAGWDSKFFYNFWRPYTAIRAAETDENPATEADLNWEPLMDTPPVQDYPSTHSALGNAAATVLASLLDDKTKFTMTSPSGDSPRSFNSFSDAAKENADSRVMAGIHFRFSCEAGLTLGEKVGQWTVENHLRPLQTQ